MCEVGANTITETAPSACGAKNRAAYAAIAGLQGYSKEI